MTDRWYREAVIYCVQVDLFRDSNGDGCGDLPGLTSRLDYLSHLGITCLWLNPIHPSPLRDGGYDVADYYAVHPRLGYARRLHRADAAGRPTRHPHRPGPGRQPHLRPASLVPIRQVRPGIAVPGLVRLVAPPNPQTGARASCFPASKPKPGPTTRPPRPGTSTGSTTSSPT